MKQNLFFIPLVILMAANAMAQAEFDYELEWTDGCGSMTFTMNRISTVNYPYPADSKKAMHEGVSAVSFTIDETCSVVDQKIVKSIDASLDSLTLVILHDFEADLKTTRDECCATETMTFPIRYSLR